MNFNVMPVLVLANQEGLAQLALVLPVLLVGSGFVTVRISRIGAIWFLRRKGYWNAAPARGSATDGSWLAIGVLLATCVIVDVARIGDFDQQLQRGRAITVERDRTQQVQWESRASAATDGFLAALREHDDNRISQTKAEIKEMRYMATSTLIRNLLAALPEADDATARGILDVLAAEDRSYGNETSIWWLNYPNQLHIEAARNLARFAIEAQRPLELRQLAVDGACRLNHGWSASPGSRIADFFAMWANSDDPEFAVPPIARWLQRVAPPHLKSLTGRVEACDYLRKWGADSSETIPALEYALKLPDPKVADAARAALRELQSKATEEKR